MLSTVGEIITEVLVRSNRTTTDTFITDAMLQDWLRMSHDWAMSNKKWPFTQGRASTTWAGSEESPYFEEWKSDSIRLLQIGGKRLQKLNFEDYQIFLENNSSSTERIYSDFNRIVFVNPRVDLSGTLTAWGQYTPIIDPTDPTAKTLFSSSDPNGNDAIVEKMISYLRAREHLDDERLLHDQLAQQLLNGVWEKIGGEQFGYQGLDRGMFGDFDIISGGPTNGNFRRDQFPTY